MEQYQRLLNWQWAHNTFPSDLIRIFLGVALLVRGILFIVDPSTLEAFVEQRGGLSWFAHYVTWAHVIGGLMMTLGIFTRVAAIIQIPVLAGALAFVHLREGLFSATQSLELSALVLFLLIVVFVFGPGKISLDYRFFGPKESVA